MRTQIVLLLLTVGIAACESAPPRKKEPKTPVTPVAPDASAAAARRLQLDTLVGRWTLDRERSTAGGEPSKPPQEVLGETILLLRDGGLLIVDSPRRGRWKRDNNALRITLDPPPSTLNALFEFTVTDTEMKLSGPKGWRLVYRRDTMLAPNQDASRPE